MSNFNKEQQLALDTPLSTNVVISAGAGSGKTKTLTEKVSLLLSTTNLKPHELLVLTFTNNAAHEMKSRIINRVKDNLEIKDKIISSHIQTFDSFCEYLVSKYGDKLGISSSISIASEDVINAKILTTLDEILNEYYGDNLRYKKILLTLKKLSLHDDAPLKRIVLDLYKRLELLLPKQKEDFINKSKSIYLSKEHFLKNVDEYASYYKERIKEDLLEAYFIEKCYENINSEDTNDLYQLFSSRGYMEIFNTNINDYHFLHPTNQKLFERLLALLNLDSLSFIKETKLLINSSNELFSAPKKMYGDDEIAKKVGAIFKSILTSEEKGHIVSINNFAKLVENENNEIILDIDEEYLKIISFKDDINLIIEIEQELEKRVFNYQKVTNCFTFSSISRLALTLLDDEEISNDIRETFKYIMIDEYQDTNDLQETFINQLLKPRKSDGGNATLFVVGDAKQAIYAFRNSNVELFKARLKDKSINPEVIYMNKNYRSGEILLNEINYIFSHYMNLNHGGIDYLGGNEALSYDKEVDLYHTPYNHFGIKRIISKNGKDYHDSPTNKDKSIWEALAIINDIKNKVNDPNFLVSDKKDNNTLRRATYSDFAIIVRKKAGYDLYQRLFKENDIPLNIIYSSSLKEEDAIIVIESLVDLMGYIIGVNPNLDVRHTFASLARSYIYQYSDQQLFDILTNDNSIDTLDLTKIKNDEIYLEVESFIKEHKNDDFSEIFIAMLDKFNINKKLSLIGNINDNINKIESLYSLIISMMEMGEGITEFINLMKNISKYELNLSSEDEVSLNNAVDIMSIHASKGLERKIIYLPNSYNKYGKGESYINRPDYIFSKSNGIILPYYHLDELYKDSSISLKGSKINSLYQLNESHILNNDIDEHVRLFYVALTRAENIIYIVGDPNNRDKDLSEENLYGMLNYLPSYIEFNKSIFNKLIPLISNDELTEFNKLNRLLKEEKTPLKVNDFVSSNNYQNYLSYYNNYYKNEIYHRMDKLLDHFEKKLFSYYYSLANKFYFNNLDSLAYLFAKINLHLTINDFKSLSDYFNQIRVLVDEEGNVLEDEYEFDNDEILKSYLLDEFSLYLKEGNYLKLGINLSKSALEALNKEKLNYDSAPLELKDLLLLPLIELIEEESYLYYWSYHNEYYQDEIVRFDVELMAKTHKINKPNTSNYQIDDEEIIFTPRFKSRASKHIEETDLDLSAIFNRGTYLHHLLELVDFHTKDVSFIKNKSDQKLIKEVLDMPLFNEVNSAIKVYKEYPFYDTKRMSRGFIDLFFIKEENNHKTYYIVDYKSRHTKDDGYIRQLNIYKDNIIRLFHLDENAEFKLILLSIEDKRIFVVEGDKDE